MRAILSELHAVPLAGPDDRRAAAPASGERDLGLTAALFGLALLPVACGLAGVGRWGAGTLGVGTAGTLLAGRELLGALAGIARLRGRA